MSLRPLKERQDVIPGPTRIAHLRPLVIVLWLPAHVEQAIDRAGPAHTFAPRPIQRPAVQTRIGFGLIAPVGLGIVQRLEIADRDMDPGISIPSTRFNQQNPDVGIR